MFRFLTQSPSWGQQLVMLSMLDLQPLLQWLRSNDTVIGWLVVASVATFVASLILVPWVVVRIPADYFTHRNRHHTLWGDRHPVLRILLIVAKNLLGVLFVVLGIGLLVLPGQGLLTIFVGLLMLDFPGKYKLERYIITRRPVLNSINWLRQRAGRARLET